MVTREIFQVFHDMVKAYVDEGVDEYPDDPESIHYVHYDCSRLFVEGSDYPFFADRLFANRLIKAVEALKRGAQQNKIYIFEGPPGCGKSTFLNNLLMKFEEYANTEAGLRYETVWRFDRNVLAVSATMMIILLLIKYPVCWMKVQMASPGLPCPTLRGIRLPYPGLFRRRLCALLN